MKVESAISVIPTEVEGSCAVCDAQEGTPRPRIGRDAAHIQQFGVGQLAQRGLQITFGD
jgi:hypothetical protein